MFVIVEHIWSKYATTVRGKLPASSGCFFTMSYESLTIHGSTEMRNMRNFMMKTPGTMPRNKPPRRLRLYHYLQPGLPGRMFCSNTSVALIPAAKCSFLPWNHAAPCSLLVLSSSSSLFFSSIATFPSNRIPYPCPSSLDLFFPTCFCLSFRVIWVIGFVLSSCRNGYIKGK